MNPTLASNLRLVQQPAAVDVVYAIDGTFAGIVQPDGRWECGSCLEDGTGGRDRLLGHDAKHQQGAA